MTTQQDLRHQIPARLDVDAAVPSYSKAMSHLDTTATRELDRVGFPAGLRELVRLRASQINGCAYCVDTHSADAASAGESAQRINAVAVWNESPFFTERERAALLWTEKLTLLSVDHVPDEVFEQVRQHFSEEELANLTLVIATINAWNRFGVSFRDVPGEYTPRKH